MFKEAGQPEEWKFIKSGHGELIPMLREVLERPFEVWLTPQADGMGRVRLSKRYLGLWKTTDKTRIGGLLVFEVVNGVFQGVTAFVRMAKGTYNLEYVERQRQGLLLERR